MRLSKPTGKDLNTRMALEQIERDRRVGALADVLIGSAFGRRVALDGWSDGTTI